MNTKMNSTINETTSPLMSPSRRDFLKAATAAGCLAPFAGVSNLAFGASSHNAPLLVVVFLRGGADGLNLVAPSNDTDYIAARSAELRVTDSGERPGLKMEQSLAAGLDFRFHPDATGLSALYDARHLAVVHAVGLTDGTRSHFVAQDLIERGIADEKRISSINGGWLGRAMPLSQGKVPGISTTASPAVTLRGAKGVLAMPDVSAGSSLPWGAPTNQLLRRLNSRGHGAAEQASIAALDVLEDIDRKLPKDPKGRVLPYQPEGNANYDGAGDLSRTLGSVARLSRMDVGLSAACVDFGGWDTHEGQAGRFANQVRQLSTGLTAFHNDMAASGRKVTVLVMTEFGRRLRANKSGGTDHGHGACWLVLGDQVQGRNIYGQWPGLATAKLDQGVDLAVSTDYRNVLAEVLASSGMSYRDALPDWNGKIATKNNKASTLGLFKA